MEGYVMKENVAGAMKEVVASLEKQGNLVKVCISFMIATIVVLYFVVC